jgi:hypothetical protein
MRLAALGDRDPAHPIAVRPFHDETVVDTGLEYLPGEPVRVWVVHREQRASVSDNGTALQKAGVTPAWERAIAKVHAELDVNISRGGVVCLPIVPAGPSEQEVVARIGRASLIFFQELLELQA